MLQLSQLLLNRPILSLRASATIGHTLTPIINPNNLKIEGFYCRDRFDKKTDKVLLYQDIREILPQGIIVNDRDALTDPTPAHGDVEPLERSVRAGDCDEAEVVGEDVDVVARRHGHDDLELRGAGRSCRRGLRIRLAPGDLAVLHEELVVGPGLGSEMIADRPRRA